jgi:hypothetical protein
MWGRIIAPISMTVRRGTTIPVNLSIVFAPEGHRVRPEPRRVGDEGDDEDGGAPGDE